MSQYAQGPGWWQASDGRWYPPESHPGYAPHPPYPPHQPPAYQPPAQQPHQPHYGPLGAPPLGSGPKKSAWPWVIGALVVLVVMALVGSLLALRGREDNTISIGGVSRDVGGEGEQRPSLNEEATESAGEVGLIGAPGGVETEVIATAIADLEEWWAEELPEVYGETYEPVSGGFYSWTEGEDLPPCAEQPEDVMENAYYCSDGDVVAWDDENLVPQLYENFGDLAVATVIAHEWGHAIQARVGMDGATVTLEQQADCFAGAWVQRLRAGESDRFTVEGSALDRALAGFLEIADQPGTSALDPNAHGSAFDRINAFQEGLDDGATRCAEYSDELVGGRLVQLEFNSIDDLESGGNAPNSDIVDLASTDLEDFWSQVSPEAFNADWLTLAPAQPFDAPSGDFPSCGDADTTGYVLFYCADDRFIAYDDVGLFPEVYEAIGDFGVAALFSSQYSLAVIDRFGLSFDGEKATNLAADCLTGSWTASVFLQNRSTSRFILSPGDFDEAVKALLSFSSTDAQSAQGTGFERVSSFRAGVIDGIGACVG